MHGSGSLKLDRPIKVCHFIDIMRKSRYHKDTSHEVRSTLLTEELYQRPLIGRGFKQEGKPKVL